MEPHSPKFELKFKFTHAFECLAFECLEFITYSVGKDQFVHVIHDQALISASESVCHVCRPIGEYLDKACCCGFKVAAQLVEIRQNS